MTLDAASIASIDQELQILSSVRTQQHLSHAQARGIVQLFNFYFREKDSNGRTKRLSKDEKNRRWKIYKVRVYKDYNRVIKSEFNSEAALVKRYSDPLSFLKYKLKRYRNLKVSDLTPADQQYYKEIGGIDDVEELRRRQANIDSIDKGVERLVKRRRLNEPESNGNDLQSIDSNILRNHNISHQQHTSSVSVQNLPPRVPTPMPQLSRVEEPKMDQALQAMWSNFNDFEKEQMEKKKDTAQILTQEKTKAFLRVLSDQISSKPDLIGMIPGLSNKDQLTNAFHGWLSKHMSKILASGVNRRQMVRQITLLKGDNVESMLFLQEWKVLRIVFQDEFRIVWTFVRRELAIELVNPKEEMDEDEEKTITIDDDLL